MKCGVISRVHNLVCHLCLGSSESHSYMFLFCFVSKSVWSQIMDWMGLSRFPPSVSILDHLLAFATSLKERIKKKFRLLTWLAVNWSIFLIRNETLFKGGYKQVREIVFSEKAVS